MGFSFDNNKVVLYNKHTHSHIKGTIMPYLNRGSTLNGQPNLSDKENQAFNNGGSFRIDMPFSIPQNGGPFVIKYTISQPVILTLSTIEIDQGGVLYKVYTEEQATETQAFTTSVPLFPKNTFVTPKPAPAVVEVDGAATFTGQQNTTLRVRSASGGGNRNSTVTGESTSRGFGASVLYTEITALDGVNIETRGVLKQEIFIP